MNGPLDPRDLDYFPPGEPWHNGPDAPAPKFRRIINPAEWEGLPVPPREWIVPGYIPHKTVTLLSGDGSVGKSLLALQLAVGRALAREWIGLMPEPGRTLILSAEDDADEMHRRLEDIRLLASTLEPERAVQPAGTTPCAHGSISRPQRLAMAVNQIRTCVSSRV